MSNTENRIVEEAAKVQAEERKKEEAEAKLKEAAKVKAEQEAARTQTDPNPEPTKKVQEPLRKTPRGKGRGLSLAGNRRKL